uniref:Uncharacterized protein n=1 Tax=Oryza punctata TaxID=4537 RepID=A0A0E0MCJ2_ORYPU
MVMLPVCCRNRCYSTPRNASTKRRCPPNVTPLKMTAVVSEMHVDGRIIVGATCGRQQRYSDDGRQTLEGGLP